MKTQHQQKNKFFKQEIIKKWTSNKNHHTVLKYIEATQEELECKRENQKPHPFNNLTKSEGTALQELNERDDTVITKADEGGGVVITDVKDYIKEAESQLKIRIIIID